MNIVLTIDFWKRNFFCFQEVFPTFSDVFLFPVHRRTTGVCPRPYPGVISFFSKYFDHFGTYSKDLGMKPLGFLYRWSGISERIVRKVCVGRNFRVKCVVEFFLEFRRVLQSTNERLVVAIFRRQFLRVYDVSACSSRCRPRSSADFLLSGKYARVIEN